MLGILIAVIVVGVLAWILWQRRADSRRSSRPKIRGQTCPSCRSDDIHWAGYADRKECAKCGKIFS